MKKEFQSLQALPRLNAICSARFNFSGVVGNLIQALSDRWLLVAPLANPAMLEIFADRDSQPYRNMMPWAGEFAGKYLTSAILVWSITRNPQLHSMLEKFVSYLISYQDSDGYLGPWPKDCRLTNYSPHHGKGGMQTWDTWSHYHIMIGLLLWYEETGDESAFKSVCKIADLVCTKYLGKNTNRLVDQGSTDMNLAPVHALTKLFRITANEKYLEMALQIVNEFSVTLDGEPLAGDYLEQALTGKEFFQMPKPRWESLHSIMALVELFWITGENKYKQAYERIWWSIVRYDRHNNGGFSSGEQAVGNPYDPGTIETCCTIAWIVLSAEMLKLTGNSIVADEIELSTFNSVLGMHSNTGRWVTFTTPMDGARFASGQAIVFQSRSGSPELNCCSVNSPRGLGMLREWALMNGKEGIYLNYYGPSSIKITLDNQRTIQIDQETDYPVSGKIKITVSTPEPLERAINFRIPYWSRNTHIYLNHEELTGFRAGEYYCLTRIWDGKTVLELQLDMCLHFWRGEKQCDGLVSIFRGPILLAYDQRYNRNFSDIQKPVNIPDDPFKVTREHLTVPEIDATAISVETVAWKGWFPPMLLLQAQTPDGKPVYLCDFASAGRTGTLYRSWLEVLNAPERVEFRPENPLRSRPLTG